MYLLNHPSVSGRSKRSSDDYVDKLKRDNRVGAVQPVQKYINYAVAFVIIQLYVTTRVMSLFTVKSEYIL